MSAARQKQKVKDVGLHDKKERHRTGKQQDTGSFDKSQKREIDIGGVLVQLQGHEAELDQNAEDEKRGETSQKI